MFLFILGFCMVKVFLPPLRLLLIKTGLVRENFRGVQIPAALGLVFPLTLPLAYLLLGLGKEGLPLERIFMLLFFVTSMGLLGFCDDVFKDDDHKGLRGHLSELLRGRLTSGGLKALLGLVFSLIFAAGLRLTGEGKEIGGWWWRPLIHLPLGALAANSLNLFDLRPGRAGKVFILASAVFLLYMGGIAHRPQPALYLLLPALGAVLAYLPTDLGATGMMGDTGANFLGALFGGVVIMSEIPFLWIMSLVFLALLHWYAEHSSITETIEDNPILKFLDDLGRD